MRSLPSRVLLGWGVLGLLLAALGVGAATFDRASWPGVVGDEATYIMAAQSLAYDGDYRYSASDYERFVATVDRPPDGLILQSPDSGETMLFGKPFFYPAYLAPFVRLAGVRGPALANFVLLALSSVFAALALRQRFDEWAPVVVAALVFGSVQFAHTFWAHSDLFLACLVATAYAVAFGEDEPAEGRLVLSAVLLATVAMSRPFYAALALPLLLLGFRRSRRALMLVAVGLAATFAVYVGTNLSLRGSWSSYSGERQGYYSYTGFPEVGEEAPGWERSVGERGPNSWTRNPLPFGFEATQSAWNVVYLLAGRHTGLLLYFLPILLALWGARAEERNLAVVVGFCLVAAAFLLVRPYNYYGGGGALANRYLLPAIPALWFLRGSWQPWRLPAVLAVSALFVAPLWAAPRGYLLEPDRTYRYPSAVARWLPYESTQSHLKPSGREDFIHASLWIKPLDRGVQAVGDPNAEWLSFDPTAGDGALLLGSREPLVAIDVEKDGAVQTVVPRRRAFHRMWWSDDPIYLYRLDLSSALPAGEGRLRFVVRKRGA
ncbi:MAG: hypothetical protein AAGA81_03565 [Acidobacteriota bacterium]